ncbi:M24 family metallopeptidase [Enterococcus ureasiticus]|uniref:Proline dipeptidase n=1 Tax=Enterococcus ureasiticus TaxID=903984 RepID=A0A1E5GA25_9ENTE|nr:Xaa-Pro peptidase family protein [Enterococcus ureasiticus]OEG09558.1 proline dipeptidase [Enterococcus ureasiticus]
MRIEKVKAQLEKQKLDGIIITDKINWRYLTGFTGSNGWLVITENSTKLFVDGRYTEQASLQTNNIEVIEASSWSDIGSVLGSIVKNKRIGFEQQTISYEKFLLLNQLMRTNLSELIPTMNLVETLRMIKSESEIVALRKAAAIADKTLTDILPLLSAGMTEIDVANEIDYRSKKNGSEGPAFETIVASGTRTALPHGHASQKIIKDNELIMIDFGTIYKGYYSDITRTMAFGSVDQKIKTIYVKLLAAQEKAIANLQLNQPLAEIDQLVRKELASSDLDAFFSHDLGHGIGLSCHEFPAIAKTEKMTLQKNMTFTIEPGVYLPNQFGIRIEDDILINENGKAEVLTKFPKNWSIIQ